MRSLIATTAALAVASRAFLLPPEVSTSDIAAVNALGLAGPDSQVVEVPCPGCPVLVKNRHGKVRVKTDKENHLSFLFKVEHQGDSDRLVVNGFELYPHSDPIHNSLTAPQTIDRHHRNKHHGKSEVVDHKEHGEHRGPSHHQVVAPNLGFSMQSMVAKAKDDSGSEQVDIVALELQIIEVGNTFVNDVPIIRVKMFKDSQGRLTIDYINAMAAAISRPLPLSKSRPCNNPMCRWIAFIEGQLGRPPCADKNKHGSQSAASQPTRVLPSHHKWRPGHFETPLPKQRTWFQLAKNVASHILLPIVIGIVAGVGASLIGMMVGTFIVMVWRTFFRKDHPRCRPGHCHKAAQKEAIASDEKAGLIDEQVEPPAYEEEAVNANEESEPAKDAPKA